MNKPIWIAVSTFAFAAGISAPASTQEWPQRPIRIIVANGHVTLYGAVDSKADKNIAGIRAGQVFGAFSVDNKLEVAGRS